MNKPLPRHTRLASSSVTAPLKHGAAVRQSALQTKAAAHRPQKAAQVITRTPVAPPVYRPQPIPKVLQTKRASGQQPLAHTSPRQPVAPPIYRPQPMLKVLQRMTTRSAPVQPLRWTGAPGVVQCSSSSEGLLPWNKVTCPGCGNQYGGDRVWCPQCRTANPTMPQQQQQHQQQQQQQYQQQHQQQYQQQQEQNNSSSSSKSQQDKQPSQSSLVEQYDKLKAQLMMLTPEYREQLYQHAKGQVAELEKQHSEKAQAQQQSQLQQSQSHSSSSSSSMVTGRSKRTPGLTGKDLEKVQQKLSAGWAKLINAGTLDSNLVFAPSKGERSCAARIVYTRADGQTPEPVTGNFSSEHCHAEMDALNSFYKTLRNVALTSVRLEIETQPCPRCAVVLNLLWTHPVTYKKEGGFKDYPSWRYPANVSNDWAATMGISAYTTHAVAQQNLLNYFCTQKWWE